MLCYNDVEYPVALGYAPANDNTDGKFNIVTTITCVCVIEMVRAIDWHTAIACLRNRVLPAICRNRPVKKKPASRVATHGQRTPFADKPLDAPSGILGHYDRRPSADEQNHLSPVASVEAPKGSPGKITKVESLFDYRFSVDLV